MAFYLVDLRCECGRGHRVINELQRTPRPDQAGTVSELYLAGNLPPELVRLFAETLTWCDLAEDYIELEDPARIVLTPGLSFV